VDTFLRVEGHDMFKTINISGFVSFLLYVGLVGAFVGLGFIAGSYCCPAYDPENGAKGIINELENLQEKKNRKSDLQVEEEKIRDKMRDIISATNGSESVVQNFA
jgi:hypothetical protein